MKKVFSSDGGEQLEQKLVDSQTSLSNFCILTELHQSRQYI